MQNTYMETIGTTTMIVLCVIGLLTILTFASIGFSTCATNYTSKFVEIVE